MVCKWNEEKDSMHTYHQMMTMNYQNQELKMTKKRELNYWSWWRWRTECCIWSEWRRQLSNSSGRTSKINWRAKWSCTTKWLKSKRTLQATAAFSILECNTENTEECNATLHCFLILLNFLHITFALFIKKERKIIVLRVSFLRFYFLYYEIIEKQKH